MDKKIKTKYLYSIALFLSLLVITIPFYTSSVFAATGVESIEDLDAGQACVEKNKRTHALVDALDNDIIKTLEKIASVMHAISAAWTATKAVLNTVILILAAIENTPWGAWAKPIRKALERYRTTMDNPVSGGLMKFILGAVGCTWWSEWGAKCTATLNEYSLGPYDNIYLAVGCLCPNAVLFNMRKLKTIYQTYGCCIEQACTNGMSTESCERQLSEQTCMYWGKGAIANMFMTVIVGLVVGWIMKNLIKKWLKELPDIVGTLVSIAEFALFDYPSLKEGMKWMQKTFAEPTCEELGFDKLKEEMEDEYTYSQAGQTQVRLVDTDGDGVWDTMVDAVTGKIISPEQAKK